MGSVAWRSSVSEDDRHWGPCESAAGNHNLAKVQNTIHHMAPTGIAGFVQANSSMSSNQSGEVEIRHSSIELSSTYSLPRGCA